MKRAYNLFTRYSKYRAVRVTIDGINFPSRAEGMLYAYLKAQGIVFQCQPKVYLTKARILFKPDFRDLSKPTFYEMKGVETASWRIKRRLWKSYGPGELQVFKMKQGKPYLFEKVIPDELSCE